MTKANDDKLLVSNCRFVYRESAESRTYLAVILLSASHDVTRVASQWLETIDK